VRPFDDLTARGQTRRLRDLARAALADYGIDGARISLLKESFNTLFRVDAGGRTFALRVGARERIHTDETEAVETAWLHALRAETDIGAPLPIANRAGGFVTEVAIDGVPETRRCVMFEWTRGRQLWAAVDTESMARAGDLLARLHEHGARFEGGRRQPVIAGDTVTVFRLPDRVPRVDEQYGTLFAEAFERARNAVDALWANPPQPPHLLHGDFHPNNILVWRGHLTPIDFQDLLWGFEVQDIAIAATTLGMRHDPDPLVAALRSGYERVRPWPADDALVHELTGARRLSIVNLGCNLRRPGFDAWLADHAAWLRKWMADARPA
jgi:Ser/Thr protein kinase RdoA (MazF antagonist)